MKRLSVTIALEMEVPDTWEVRTTSEGTSVLKIGPDQYMDLTFEPMLAKNPEDTWTNSGDDEFVNSLLDMVVTEDVTYELAQIQ
ncbi:MAG TPA: hypothetical protein VF816_03110 [Rhodocyclaceae bacterium]